MKSLSTERSRVLAEQQGWSPGFAQGFVEGETSRRLGGTPTLHAMVGIDEYSLGFRAGFFERKGAASQATRAEPAALRQAGSR